MPGITDVLSQGPIAFLQTYRGPCTDTAQCCALVRAASEGGLQQILSGEASPSLPPIFSCHTAAREALTERQTNRSIRNAMMIGGVAGAVVGERLGGGWMLAICGIAGSLVGRALAWPRG